MKTTFKFFVLGAAFALTTAGIATAQTEITIEYAYPNLFNEVHTQIAKKFNDSHDDIKVKIRSSYKDYEDGTQKVLRQAMTNTLPDITFQGLNRFRILVDREIAQPLDDFIAKEKKFSAQGFDESMFSTGRFNGKVYALPFAISLPIAYYNMDLAKKAGYSEETLPKTWGETYTYAAKVDALDDHSYGMYFDYQITGNWLWQALVFSQGGAMLTADEKKVAFDRPEGVWAINTFSRMMSEGKMPDRSRSAAFTDFMTGRSGLIISSTSNLGKMEKTIGDQFELVTSQFPGVKPEVGRLPAGGNGAMIVAKNAKQIEAAWEVLKFWCGPMGSEIMARNSGYMPANRNAVANLQDFYKEHSNHLAAVQSMPWMTGWYAFPGANGLKITDVIYGGLERIATGKEKDAQAVLTTMSDKVQALLPK